MATTEASQQIEGTFEKSNCEGHHCHPKREDPWSDVLEYLQKKDQARCADWKDAVHYLLIFAGLFSGIVTAFLLNAYKLLQQDPEDVAVVLLSRIVSQLQNSTETTQTSSLQVPFSPTPSAIRVNVFWFLSLVLSLAAVLVGIVGLQWLRVHQKPLHGVPPRTAVSLMHMQMESLDEWYVPQVFSALPLLLQMGLILFLSGLIDFLWHINRLVSYPVLAAICLLFLFLSLSTVLPALRQHFPRISKGKKVPSPCPYNSPQSQLVIRIALSIRHIVKCLMCSPSSSPSTCQHHSDGKTCQECWLYYRDLNTSHIRDGVFKKSIKEQSIPSLYDSILALGLVHTNVPSLGPNLHKCLDCMILEGREAEKREQEYDRENYQVGYLRHVLELLRLSSRLSPLPVFHLSSERDALRLEDEIQLRFSEQQKPVFLNSHTAAAHISFTAWLMFTNKDRNETIQEIVDIVCLPIERIAQRDLSKFPETSQQIIKILEKVFKHGPNDSFPLHIGQFLPAAAEILAKGLPVNDTAQEEHKKLLDSVASRLQVNESPTHSEPTSYLYLTASRYAYRLDSERDLHCPSLKLPELTNLQNVLRTYKDATGNARNALASRLGLPRY